MQLFSVACDAKCINLDLHFLALSVGSVNLVLCILLTPFLVLMRFKPTQCNGKAKKLFSTRQQ
jgi:hypothetical protein